MIKLYIHNIILPKYLEMVKNYNPAEKNRAKPEKQKGKKEGGLGEGIFALLRLELERFRFSLIKRKPKQKIFQFLLKEKNGGGRKKLKKCIEKISVLVRRSEAEASGNAPTELPPYRSVRESLEPPRAPRVISRGSVQKKLEFQPKGTAILQFQRFGGFLFLHAPAARSRSARKGLILQRFATLRVAKKKCFGFGFGSSFWRSQSKTKFCNHSFFVSPIGETWKQ